MSDLKILPSRIREWLRSPFLLAAASLLLGTVFGLVVLGWFVWPVEYVNTTPDMLRSDIQLDFLRMTVDSYSVNGDANLARSRFAALGADKWNLLEQLRLDVLMDTGRLQQFETLIATLVASGEEIDNPSATPAQGTNAMDNVLSLIAVLGILIGGASAVILLLNIRRSRSERQIRKAYVEEPDTLSVEAEEAHSEEVMEEAAMPEAEVEAESGGTEPLERFVTNYALGDDLYEDSFTINSPSGDFLGECGVGISEPIGVGGPKKITAFEVWLFDRKPSRTSTIVLVSQYAFQKEDLRAALAPRGKPVLVEPGSDIWMETPGLQLRVVVRDAKYGQGPMPANSFFEKLTLQLEVWSKENSPQK